ncbi:MAG: hypothetical protein ICV52_19235 [Microcoleus sp. C1-bin4]|nr:hypothetical protein [Microcoleus sp. C1-bin4]
MADIFSKTAVSFARPSGEKMSLSPDGLEFLLNRIVAKKSEPVTGDLRTDGPSAIAQSNLMLLSLKKTSKLNGAPSPQPLPLQALLPQWLP